jgi:hypothetical protein
VVAKILSRSESWGRSTVDDVQSWSAPRGAVLERPVFERPLGTRSADSEGRAWGLPSSPGGCEAFDLTGVEGEVLFGAFAGCDMGATLVRPLEGGVCGRMADMARRAAQGS